MAETIDISSLSDDQLADLAVRCLDSLSLSQKVQAVLHAFHGEEERNELASWLEEEPEEG